MSSLSTKPQTASKIIGEVPQSAVYVPPACVYTVHISHIGFVDLETSDTRTFREHVGHDRLHRTCLARFYYPGGTDDAATMRQPWLPHQHYATATRRFFKHKGFKHKGITTWWRSTSWRAMPMPDPSIQQHAVPDTRSPHKQVVILSHDTGMHRAAYSALCADLVRQTGFVVIAVEHRDGSAGATSVNNGQTLMTMCSDTRANTLKQQLHTRVAEVDAVLHVLRKMARGEAVLNLLGGTSILAQLGRMMDVDAGVYMLGHGYV